MVRQVINIRPLLQLAEVLLVKMLLIKVALRDVILIGLEISGKTHERTSHCQNHL